MRIGIIEISGWHYEYFDTFCEVFSNEIQEIYTLKKYEQQIDKEKIKRTTFLKKRGNYISIISLYKCIKKINESNSDFYFILTSDCNYIFLFFLVLLTNKKIIMTLHNINSWMKKPKILKNKIKYFFKMKILEKVYGINVIADNLREYLTKEYNYSKMITVIPYTFFKEIKNSKSNESEKIISVPGSADLNRRNYNQVIELANIREDIKIYLLGRKNLEFNKKYKVLPKNVISFENYISQEEYETQKEAFLKQSVVDSASAPMVSASEAYKSYWKKYFTWKGRSTRAEYWWPVLVNFLIAIILSVVEILTLSGSYLTGIFQLLIFIPGLSVLVRRIHDVGHSAWFALSPLVLMLALAVLAVISAVLTYAGVVSPAINSVKSFIFILGGIAMVVLSLVVMVFCCFEGTRGANKYGEAR